MARVSSDEQAKGYSLDIQTEKLLSHCQRENISVVNIYKEDHSAKNFNRPEFKKLLQYLSKNKNKVDYLLVTSWDRFSRNVTESFAIINRLKQYGCEVRAIEQPLDLTIPENLMILSVYLALPDIDNRRRSIKITEGVRAAKKNGRWLGKAPFGYKVERDEKNKPLLVAGEKAKIVRRIFNDIANGQSQAEVRATLKKKGIYFAETTFSELIRNRLYIGEIFVTADKAEDGYYVKGVHHGLIDESLFTRVQEIIQKNQKRNKTARIKSFREDFLLRGMIKCDNCGNSLTGSSSRSRNGNYHDYYHCNHCHKVRLRTSDVDDRIDLILGEIKVNGSAKKLYDAMVKKIFSENEVIRKRPIDKIEQEIAQYEGRIRKLHDGFADNQIDAASLNSSVNRYKKQIEMLKGELEFNKQDLSQHQRYLAAGIDLLSDITGFYKKADPQIKRKLLGSIFPENLFFSKEKSRTTRLNEAVRLILATNKGFREQKTGKLFKNLTLPGNVEVTGVEPVTFCMPCKRSSQLS